MKEKRIIYFLIKKKIYFSDYLQSIELSKRSIALTLIANVLRYLPNTFLTSNESKNI